MIRQCLLPRDLGRPLDVAYHGWLEAVADARISIINLRGPEKEKYSASLEKLKAVRLEAVRRLECYRNGGYIGLISDTNLELRPTPQRAANEDDVSIPDTTEIVLQPVTNKDDISEFCVRILDATKSALDEVANGVDSKLDCLTQFIYEPAGIRLRKLGVTMPRPDDGAPTEYEMNRAFIVSTRALSGMVACIDQISTKGKTAAFIREHGATTTTGLCVKAAGVIFAYERWLRPSWL
jgi:hypothetical protein